MARKTNSPGVTGYLELATTIHDTLDLPNDRHGEPATGYAIVRAILVSMRDALHRGEDVYVRGFGILRVVERVPKRTGHNLITNKPNTFSPVPIAHCPRKYVIFIPSQPLSAMLNIDSPNFEEARAMENW